MEKEQEYTTTQEQETSALTAENIADLITEELAKVVGIDTERLTAYVEFLGTMKIKDVDALLKTLKKSLGEQAFPLAEVMARHERATLAEIGISALGAIHTFKAAQLLAEINENYADKKLCKAARKSLYKLQSAGIDVEMTHKPLLGEQKHERYKALISPVDGTGTQLAMLTQEMLAGDLQLLQVVAGDDEGIVECSSRRGMTKNMFAKLPESFARQTGASAPMIVEADYDYAMSLILAAEEVTNDLPEEYEKSKDFFELSDAQAVENPIFQMLDVENLKEQPYFLRTSKELFQNDVFLSWHLSLGDVAGYVQEILDQEDSELELSPQFQQERKEEIYAKCITEQIDEELLSKLERRLQRMAYLFMQQGNDEDAKRALIASLTLAEQTEAARLKDHPFLREFLLISFEAAQYVLEEGYDPTDLKRDEYIVGRDEDGALLVEFLQE